MSLINSQEKGLGKFDGMGVMGFLAIKLKTVAHSIANPARILNTSKV